MENVPVSTVLGSGAILAALPALLLVFFFGRQGLMKGLGLVATAMSLYLFWFFVLNERGGQEGMEELVFISFPVFFIGMMLSSLAIWAVIGVIGLLPHQRARRREKTSVHPHRFSEHTR